MVTTRFLRETPSSLIAVLVMATCIGCSSGDHASADASGAVAASAVQVTQLAKFQAPTQRDSASAGKVASATSSHATPTQRQVIRHAELEVRVASVEKAEKDVNAILKASGGYAANESSTDLASVHPVLTMALKVPVASFDESIAKFEALGTRLAKKVDSRDVTTQIVDLDARLRVLQAQEETYRKMLTSKNRLDDVFTIQNHLEDVRTQIETLAAERKNQAGLAALSDVQLTLQQSATFSAANTDPSWLNQAWGEASTGASFALKVAAVLLIWVVCFSPFWIPLVLVLRKVLRPRRQVNSGL